MNARSLLMLALSRVSFLRPRERLLLAELLESPDELVRVSKKDLEMTLNRRIRSESWDPAELVRQAEACDLYLTKRDILCTFYTDKGYPSLLKEIYDPPLVLYYRGILPPDNVPMVAVVGTRRPSGNALHAAFEIGLELAAEGAVTVSGLARGIDRAAHRGCVEGQGRALAVMGNGIDTVHPYGSRRLAEMILESGGALLSEYPPGTPPLKHHFPARNRIISGLSQAVIVVEAPEKSGALITSDFALEQGRDLFVHETGCTPGPGNGTRALAEQGAVTITRVSQVLPGRSIDNDGDGNGTSRVLSRRVVEERSSPGLAELLELELQDKVFLLDGEVYWRE
jgi:DNA processing protein